MPDTEAEIAMAQEGYDTLMSLINSRYRLSVVTGRRAAQLKQGTPSTLTHKAIGQDDNAVSVAMKELEQGSGVRWDDALPSAEEIGSQVQRDRRDAAEESRRYSILQDGPGKREGDNAS
jgi:DNA-directed RNA polymerase subunit omega